MRQNTPRTHIYDLEMPHILAFSWYFFTFSRDRFKSYRLSLQKVSCFDRYSAHRVEVTQKCTHFCFKLQSVSTFKLIITYFHPHIQINLLHICCLQDFVLGTLYKLPFRSLLTAAKTGSTREALWCRRKGWGFSCIHLPAVQPDFLYDLEKSPHL